MWRKRPSLEEINALSIPISESSDWGIIDEGMDIPKEVSINLVGLMYSEREDFELIRKACTKQYQLNIPRKLFSYALDLMYSGHEDLGWQFIEQAWSSRYPLDDQMLIDMRERLEKSPYWGEVQAFQRK